jgi:hypothetical protein
MNISLAINNLDIELPDTVEAEAKKINDLGLFIPHRTSHGRGWESATLHGENWNVTHYDETKKDSYRWTDLVPYAPTMTDWLQNVFPNNGNYGRCRFMLLRPGGYIRTHTDTHNWVKGAPLKDNILSAINISITQPKNCYLRDSITKEEVPFEPRSVFWFNNGPFHEAANFSKENRYHFIIHGGNNKEREELFINSFYKAHPDAIV